MPFPKTERLFPRLKRRAGPVRVEYPGLALYFPYNRKEAAMVLLGPARLRAQTVRVAAHWRRLRADGLVSPAECRREIREVIGFYYLALLDRLDGPVQEETEDFDGEWRVVEID